MAVCIVFGLGPGGSPYRVCGTIVFKEPIVMYLTLLFRRATNYHRCHWSPECIVIDLDWRSRNVSTVFAVTPTVHVETVAKRNTEFDIVPGHIPTP